MLMKLRYAQHTTAVFEYKLVNVVNVVTVTYTPLKIHNKENKIDIIIYEL
jgi:hypothetical protein